MVEIWTKWRMVYDKVTEKKRHFFKKCLFSPRKLRVFLKINFSQKKSTFELNFSYIFVPSFSSFPPARKMTEPNHTTTTKLVNYAGHRIQKS
jgi:hypothetical protein